MWMSVSVSVSVPWNSSLKKCNQSATTTFYNATKRQQHRFFLTLHKLITYLLTYLGVDL